VDFHCSLIPVPVSPHGILNGDTKATLVAWGDDITFLDRDEDNGRHRRIPRHFEHRALKTRFLRISVFSPIIPFLFLHLFLLFYFSTRRGEENLRLQWRDLQKTMIGIHIGAYFKIILSLNISRISILNQCLKMLIRFFDIKTVLKTVLNI